MSALDALRYLTRLPTGGKAEGALILFHGRGSDEHDLYRLLDDLDPAGRLLGVTVRGPLSLPPGGAHWYVVQQVGFPDPTTFFETRALLDGWLAAFTAETGVPPAQTILGGFSQGAVMTWTMGLGEGRPRPAGLVALSGFIPKVPGFALDLSLPLPPVAIGHGTLDGVIPVTFGQQARDRLMAAGAQVLYHESPIRHGIHPAFLDQLAPWVTSVVDGLAPAPAPTA